MSFNRTTASIQARATKGFPQAPAVAEGYRVHIEWALGNRDRRGAPISFSGAAEKLNEQHPPSPMGGRWSWRTVRDIARRLGFLIVWPLCRPNCWELASNGAGSNIPDGPPRN